MDKQKSAKGKDGDKKEDAEPAKADKAPAEDAKEEAKSGSVKGMKNKFAINRLTLMLRDVDPAEMSAEMIHDLIKVYHLLEGILKRQNSAD